MKSGQDGLRWRRLRPCTFRAAPLASRSSALRMRSRHRGRAVVRTVWSTACIPANGAEKEAHVVKKLAYTCRSWLDEPSATAGLYKKKL